ncbi:MAG: transglycosylase domain-containing protein [Bacteroidota bacterium]
MNIFGRIWNWMVNSTDNKYHKFIVKNIWRITLLGIVAVLIFFVALSFSDLPSVKQLENPRSKEATLIYGINGEIIGRSYDENRIPVDFQDLSPNLVNALIATEDERYREHSGIDFQALSRALVKTLILQDESSGGASTITQQLAKLLFTGQRANNFTERVFQKLKEWIIAVRLERRYTKEEILAMYLNKFDFLNEGDGIRSASENYFGKPQDSLEIQEAAVLVAMLKNPTLYNPLRNETTKKRTLQRRNVVMNQMVKNNMLSQKKYDELKELPLGINFSRKTHIDGIATYFRTETKKDVKKILSQQEYRKSDGSVYDIDKDGLRIFTTIDPQMQELAEQAMVKHMKRIQGIFDRHWKNLDPWTYKNRNSENDISVEYRQRILDRLVRETKRYESLRKNILLANINQLRKEFPKVTFHGDDREVVRMMDERARRGYLNDLVVQKIISSETANAYRRIMKSSTFQTTIDQWSKLQEAVKKDFNSKTNMKVFTYENASFEKDTSMTPLDSIKYHRKFLQTGIMAVDPATGYVKAWVGGINYKYFKYDHVRTDRQVGSTFKPFVYATAIALQGISPCFKVPDVQQSIGPGDGRFYLEEPWTPDNFNEQFTGELFTLRRGLQKSKNTVSVYLMKQLGDTQPVRGLVENMGIPINKKHSNGQLRVPKVPSICLGVSDLTVHEMTGAYSTFANNGIHVKPTHIMRIEDKNGTVIYQHIPEDRRALPENANYVMVDMLKSAAGNLWSTTTQKGGKTGTTNDFVDGWFMGITPDLVVGTWVGGEDKWIRFRSPNLGQGSAMAKPFFNEFMRLLENTEGVDFDMTKRFYRPPGSLGIELDCSKYELDGLGPNEEMFEEEFEEDQFGDEMYFENQGNNNNN